jgi:hypothetical protein
MADKNFKSGPGGRLKKEEEKNTLYVSNPNNPRLQVYQDSLSLSKSNFYIPYGERVFKDSKDFKKSFAEKIKRLGLSRDGKYVDVSNYLKGIQPVDYADYDRNRSLLKNNEYTTVIYKKPERPVVLVKRPQSNPIEPIATRQVSIPTITPNEIVAPVVRPVPQSNLRPEDGPMGFALRYPAQTFMNKLKARITGKPNMPYWIDREGIKRYPSMGENSPEEVRMMEMLKSNLNPNVPEDAAELKRIDLLRKMRSKDRKEIMGSSQITQE